MTKRKFEKKKSLKFKKNNNKDDDDSYMLSDIDFSVFDGDLGFTEYEKKAKKQKQNKKKIYIPLSKLNEDYEFHKIINGIKTGKKTFFQIEIFNKHKKKYLTRINNTKLKILAPTLLCDYYETRLHFN